MEKHCFMSWLGMKYFSHPTDLSKYKKKFCFAVEQMSGFLKFFQRGTGLQAPQLEHLAEPQTLIICLPKPGNFGLSFLAPEAENPTAR